MALRAAGLLCGVVEAEAAGALDIVVPSVSERRMRADDDLLAASRQLDRRELLLVVLLERGTELGDQAGVGRGQRLDVGDDICELLFNCASVVTVFDVWPEREAFLRNRRHRSRGKVHAGAGVGVPRPGARPPRRTRRSINLTWSSLIC